MSRPILAFMQFLAIALMCLALPARASIDAPNHIYYGSATLYGVPAPANTVVEARAPGSGAVLARYVIGSSSHMGNSYRIDILMDQVEPRTEGRARPGDPLNIYLGGQLAAQVSGGVGAVGATTRLDLDPQNTGTGPAISIADAQVYEGQTGLTNVDLAITLNTSAAQALTVYWETRNGTAIGGPLCGSGADFRQLANQALVIPAGATSATLRVQVCGDTVVEPDETFTVELLSTLGNFGVFAKSTAVVTIQDDDDVPTLAVDAVRVAEPPSGSSVARFVAKLSRSHTRTVSFQYATQGGSAQPGADFVAASGTLSFEPGDIEKNIDVTILADAATEPDETFRLQFSNPVSLVLAQTFANGVIVDPTHDPAVEEVDAQTGAMLHDLAQPSAIALSPDGLHAYATSDSRGAVVHFQRDPGTGVLSPVSSYTVATTGFEQARLKGLKDIRISADGAFVYLAALRDNAVTVLSRDAATGALGFVHSVVHGGSVLGLEEVVRLALSPDGMQLYALGRRSNAIVTLSRDAVTGQLGFVRSQSKDAPGLLNLVQPSGIAVSADGAQVYVTASGGNAVIAFDRNGSAGDADFGKLTLKHSYVNGLAGVSGILGAHGLALSPDGHQLYVAASASHSLVHFDRAADGSLTHRGVWKHGDAGVYGLRGAHSVAVAPNGREVFVTGAGDDSLTVFNRTIGGSQAGALSVHRTVFKGDNGLNHLSIPGAMAASGDDRFLYVAASGGDGAVITYRRLSADILFSDGFEPPPVN
ncbi:MAG: beta-propeller fold lactonase family protein [Xanthomonadaceae bacterium]|nr:beta-propeller fold lactonase family protein [Xanthomonadaceae bacterium]